MKTRNSRYRSNFLILMILGLMLILPTIIYFVASDISPNRLIIFNKLRPSQQDINIITPENKTYIGPMSGYYPGTYGFENDNIGNVPSNWSDNSGSDCSVQVIDSLDGHNQVLDCYDNSDSNISAIENNFSNQSYGTIEFWIRTTNSTAYTDIDFLIEGTQVFTFIIQLDKFNYWNGSAMNYIADAYDNLWQHIRIDFECTTGGYQALSQYQCKVYINDVDYGVIKFWRNRTHINRILIKSHYVNTGYHSYFDAFGFSWDSNYNIGDNKEEGLLLSFTPDVLDWIKYSFDRKTNITILGNTTIPIPKSGLHSIQIFGNDAGTLIYSDIRYFTIRINPFIKIITPQNQTYLNPMSGYYPGTFGFENDNIGDSPYTWEDLSGNDCSSQVIGSLDGHNHVLDCYDNSNLAISAIDNNFSNQSYGTIEFWIRTTNTTAYTDIDFLIEGTQVFTFIIENDQFNYWNGSTMNYIADAYDNLWQHIRIDFDCTTGGYQALSQYQYKVYINDVDYGVINFWRNRTHINRILIKSHYGNTGYHSYFDAFGFSWDPNYNIGDNKEEGLLLSFISNTNFKWIGYSLDGMVDKPILGNTTINMLEDGIHSIRVVGIFVFGNLYYSTKRYFSIDSNSPIIEINSPNLNDFYGINAPNFSLSIIEPNLNTLWYSLDNGTSNFTFSGLIHTINQTVWESRPDGLITIKFYANDTWGFEGHNEVSVYKDTTSPTSLISFIPHSRTNVVNKSTIFTLTSDDGLGSGVSLIRYKIKDSNWMTYSSPFNLSIYQEGDIIISYQAIDKVGNVETENTFLVELVEKPSKKPPSRIPGFSIFILIGVLAIISLFNVKRILQK